VQRVVSSLRNAPGEAAHCFTTFEIEDATKKFEKKIGSGGFGVVYYGKVKDGREIAVKVLTSNSYQGKREFTNEVNFHFTDLRLILQVRILIFILFEY
jgi:RIO-like serine/threonine protein kinase